MKPKPGKPLAWIGCLLLAWGSWFVVRNASKAPIPHPTQVMAIQEKNRPKGILLGLAPASPKGHDLIETHRMAAATATAAPTTIPGQPVGFLLAEIDRSLLTEVEEATLYEVQEKFAAAMAACPAGPASPDYHRQWKQAQQYCDDLLRLRLGADGFNRMNSLAAQESTRLAHP